MSQEQAQASAGGSSEKTIPDVDVKTTDLTPFERELKDLCNTWLPRGGFFDLFNKYRKVLRFHVKHKMPVQHWVYWSMLEYYRSGLMAIHGKHFMKKTKLPEYTGPNNLNKQGTILIEHHEFALKEFFQVWKKHFWQTKVSDEIWNKFFNHGVNAICLNLGEVGVFFNETKRKLTKWCPGTPGEDMEEEETNIQDFDFRVTDEEENPVVPEIISSVPETTNSSDESYAEQEGGKRKRRKYTRRPLNTVEAEMLDAIKTETRKVADQLAKVNNNFKNLLEAYQSVFGKLDD